MAERNRLTPAANAEAAGSAVASRADERPAIAASAPAGEQAKLGVTEVAAAIAVDNSGPRSQPKPDASNPH
jgi:hypothetical protein